ncbi:MAG: ABC transporter substrate-binding protein, partial [Ramlibacter sp.]
MTTTPARLGPSRIVCLTEETTEWLYLLGEEARIVGISGYTVRPRRARDEKPRVSAFLTAKIDKILALEPDCVFGFSDLQADIAAALVRQGVQVTVFNQRSVEEIFSMLWQVAAMVGRGERGLELIGAMRERHRCALRKHVVAAGEADQLGHPADAGNRRLVPFLEIDARTARQLRRG